MTPRRCFSYTLYMLQLLFFFFFNDTATTEIYTLSLHDALPISSPRVPVSPCVKSRMPTRWPACAAFASVPPHVSSTSSRCAAIANKSTGCSLIAEGLHRIESRRPVGGHDTEDHADEAGDAGRNSGAPQRDGRREAQQRLEDFARGETEYDADQAAHERERRGLDEELPQDFPAGRAHRFAEPDLARAVGDGDHHDGPDPEIGR